MKSWFDRNRRSKTILLKAVAVTALASALAACSSQGNPEWKALVGLARQSFTGGPGVTLKQAAAIPYATLGVRIDGSAQSMAVLGTNTDGEQLWAIGEKIAIVTRDGRILRTAGLEHDLTWTAMNTDTAKMPMEKKWLSSRRVSWTVDFRDLNLFGILVVCDQRPVRSETISILSKKIFTIRVEAFCQSKNLNWSFRNIYWVSRTTGIVWRSIQHTHPNLGGIEFEVLRPPA